MTDDEFRDLEKDFETVLSEAERDALYSEARARHLSPKATQRLLEYAATNKLRAERYKRLLKEKRDALEAAGRRIGWFVYRGYRIRADGDTVAIFSSEDDDDSEDIAGLDLNALEQLLQWNSTRGLLTPAGSYPLSGWGDRLEYNGADRVIIIDQFGGTTTITIDALEALADWATSRGIM